MTADASYAPYALDVDEGEVGWATGTGDDVDAATYANDHMTAFFYIMDDDLEGTSDEQIATWSAVGPSLDTNGVTEGFDLLTGAVGEPDPTASRSGRYSLTGPADLDPDDPTVNNDLDENDVDTSGDNTAGSEISMNHGFATTTFTGVDGMPPAPIHSVVEMVATTTNGNVVTLTDQALVASDDNQIKYSAVPGTLRKSRSGSCIMSMM